MIPRLVIVPGSPYQVLPPGIHSALLTEIEARFVTNGHRKRLFEGFQRVAEELRKSGCKNIYLDGSFVTDKPLPSDYDGCWDPTGVDVTQLDPVLLDFRNKRLAQKQKYLGEMFIGSILQAESQTFLEFFQTERNTGTRKGIVIVEPKPTTVIT